jgi:NitT/TauT family transport system substrate-binding protein
MSIRAITAIIVTLTLAFSCTVKEDTIKIGLLEGPSAVSFMALIDKPPVIEGRKVEFIICSEPLQIQAMMMQGKLDFAVLPTVMAANLYNKGIDYKLLAVPVWGTLYLITNNPAIQQLNQLPQEKVYLFGQGSTADVLFRNYLKKYALHHIQPDYSYSTNAELSHAFSQQKISLSVISEPMVSILMAQHANIRILQKVEPEELQSKFTESSFAQTSFLVNANLTKHYSTLIHTVSEQYKESCDFTYQQPKKTAALLVKHGFYQDTAVAIQSIPRCNIRFSYAADVKETVMNYLRIFYTFEPESTGGKMPADDFIYRLPTE